MILLCVYSSLSFIKSRSNYDRRPSKFYRISSHHIHIRVPTRNSTHSPAEIRGLLSKTAFYNSHTWYLVCVRVQGRCCGYVASVGRVHHRRAEYELVICGTETGGLFELIFSFVVVVVVLVLVHFIYCSLSIILHCFWLACRGRRGVMTS